MASSSKCHFRGRLHQALLLSYIVSFFLAPSTHWVESSWLLILSWSDLKYLYGKMLALPFERT